MISHTSKVNQYVKSLKQLFDEYNLTPLSIKEVNRLNKFNTHNILYYWLYKQHKWNLSFIHDMWALNLFVDFHKETNKKTWILKWKKTNPLLIPPDSFYFQYQQSELDSNGNYKGDRIISSKIPRYIIGCTQEIYIHNPNQEIFPIQYRRLSQLLPFQKLTKLCQQQDEPFLIQNQNIFDKILK